MDTYSKLRDAVWLRQEYIERGRSASDIADELGLSTDMVKKALALLGIRKTAMPDIDIDLLQKTYLVEQNDLRATAERFGVSVWTIMKWLALSGIPRRGHNDIDKGTWRGRHHTLESKARISQSKDQGRKLESQCKHCRLTFRYYEGSGDGNFCSLECYNEYRQVNAKSWEEYDAVTDSPQYRQWRLAVYERDGYRCKWCGTKPANRRLHAHHIWPRNNYPNLIFEISNGITLCELCHYKTYYREEELAPFFDALLIRCYR